MTSFATRFAALVRKELRQMLRDRSTLAVGLVLPLILILLFGYGLSFDVREAPLATVLEDRSPLPREFLARMEGTHFLAPIWAETMPEAEALLRSGEVDAIVRFPEDFSRRFANGADGAQIQLILNGTHTTTARTLESYLGGVVST